MAEIFGHERLKVYQKGMQFTSLRKTLLDDLPLRVAACDHLYRGAESILLNIAHARPIPRGGGARPAQTNRSHAQTTLKGGQG